MRTNKYGAIRLYLFWIGFCSVFGLLIPVLSANSHTSAQVPYVLMIYAIIGLVCGTFLISLFNMFFFSIWFRKFWYVNVFITLVTGGIIACFIFRMITL